MNSLFEKLGFSPADILLPHGCDMTKWSVVACDQYTSQPEYWKDVERLVSGAPSSLRLMLPEIYLGGGDEKERIAAVNAAMEHYFDSGLFRTVGDSFVYVERTLKDQKVRRGLVGVVDLEAYDYHRGSSSLIRATEGTVLERIPPRVRVRENASLEMPHIMLLIDDPERTVIEKVAAFKDGLEKLYDFELMKDSGHITGYRVNGDRLQGIAQALSRLADPQVFEKKYNLPGKPLLVYAVGDGNHSLATAKECFEHIKKELPREQAMCHPARYAMVELVNVHDASLEFEPIHRVVFDVRPEDVIEAFFRYYPAARRGEGKGHRVEYVYKGGSGVLTCECPECGLAVGMLQNFLDDYVRRSGGKVDYIHGDEVVRNLSAQAGTVGFLLPTMGKSELFRAVISDGVLPRKTFSMGEARDKRFYLECRRIR